LIYFWRIHLAVVLAAAVATAVLTGALLVGDSMRGSLRQMSLERLGAIDHVLLSNRFLDQDLAARLQGEAAFAAGFNNAVAAIVLNGSAVEPVTQRRASKLQVVGLDGDFAALYDDESAALVTQALERDAGQLFPSVVINQTLQDELKAQIGEPILLRITQPSAIHRESLFGRRDAGDLVRTLRLTLKYVVPDRGLGRFGLQPHQHLPRNAFVALPVLQKALDRRTQANAFFVAARHAAADTATAASLDSLQQILHGVAGLADLGLALERAEGHLVLESSEFIINDELASRLEAVAVAADVPMRPVLTYMATALTKGQRQVPYSAVSAIGLGGGSDALGRLRLIDGSVPTLLAADEILLNRWTAQDLEAAVGDWVEMAYYLFGERETLLTRQARFRVVGILAMQGMAVDAGLTPSFPGIDATDDMADWDAPFPMELDRIRPQDEAYWDQYGAAPKGFIAFESGLRLWPSRFGRLTSMRLAAAPGKTLDQTQVDLVARLRAQIQPAFAGLVFQPVKADGLAAASGATDFSMLFIGFSFFLIIAAGLLIGLLFRLGVEQRSFEVGLLLAIGYPLAKVRRRFMAEGLVLSGVGGLVGLGCATLYAWLMLAGLRTWWQAAVGTPFLALYVEPLSLALGYSAALGIAVLALWRTLRQCGRMSAQSLLAGGFDRPAAVRGSRWGGFVGWGSLAAGLALVPLAALLAPATAVALFFLSGALLLVGLLALFGVWLKRQSGHRSANPGTFSYWHLAVGNSARRPGRSLLCAGLVACAAFVVVAVGANRRLAGPADGIQHRSSGTGGFALMVEADIPLHQRLDTAAGRVELGFAPGVTALDAAEIFACRRLPGEDLSCLNLYQPRRPRLLGVPGAFIERGGFGFKDHLPLAGAASVWHLLEQDLGPDVIPAIGDYNSVLWILHKGLGDEITVADGKGRPLRIRLVGLLESSIFQSELLIAAEQFTRHFPEQSGYSVFLLQPPPGTEAHTSNLLEKTLAPYGVDALSTAQRLAAYQAVENTYLSTFQTLGGLGLLLGTFGLGLVLLRNALERGGELALMRACGYRRGRLVGMLLAENGVVLLVGVMIGAVSALLSAAPHLMAPDRPFPWISLGLTLLSVLAVGLATSAGAAMAAMRRPLLLALRGA